LSQLWYIVPIVETVANRYPRPDSSVDITSGNYRAESIQESVSRPWRSKLRRACERVRFASLTKFIARDKRRKQSGAGECPPPRGDNPFHSMTENEPDALIVVDARGCIQSFGQEAERLFGYQDAEVLDRNLSSLTPARDREPHDGDIGHYWETGGHGGIAVKRIVIAQREDGSTFPMHLTIHELLPPSRGLFGAEIRDLTVSVDRARRLEELRVELVRTACMSELHHLASRVAFEVDQKLAEFGNYVGFDEDILRADVQAEAQQAMAPLLEVSERLSNIIRRLRGVLKRGTWEQRVEDLADTIEVASALALAGVHRELTLNIHVAGDAAEAVIDKNSIQQVLRQLIRNVVQSMAVAARQEITISTTRAGDMVEITIADTGPGLPANIRPRLFHPVSTAMPDASETGLSFCRDIIEANGGEIRPGEADGDAEEDADGGGGAFRFTVPYPVMGSG
jgi:two-component system, LuxR family, sensor kinase FixL